jgi:hypothetical protein
VKKIIVALNDLNRFYTLTTTLHCGERLTRIRINRNWDCHILSCDSNMSNASESEQKEALEAQKAWRYIVSKLTPDIRAMLDAKCGGSQTVDEVVNYLTNIPNSSGAVNKEFLDWFDD